MYDADGNVLLQRDPSAWTLYLPGEQITLNVSAGTEAGARIIPLPSGGDVVRTGATTSYYFEVPDIRGTSTLYLDNTAQFPTWRQFTPYGAPRGATVSWVDNRAYLNQPADPVTGLTILGARQYNPVTSQFISPDPLLHPTNPQSLNPYVYAADNPETFSDPSGKDSIAAAIVTLLATHPNPTNNATLARVYTACLHHSAAPRLGGSTEPGASGTSPRLPTAYSKIPDFEPPRVTTYPLPPDIGGTIVDPIAPELGINIIFDPLAPDLGQGKEIYPILGPWQTSTIIRTRPGRRGSETHCCISYC